MSQIKSRIFLMKYDNFYSDKENKKLWSKIFFLEMILLK